jgi:hypothetical protein
MCIGMHGKMGSPCNACIAFIYLFGPPDILPIQIPTFNSKTIYSPRRALGYLGMSSSNSSFIFIFIFNLFIYIYLKRKKKVLRPRVKIVDQHRHPAEVEPNGQ